jgi:hypothetical protein
MNVRITENPMEATMPMTAPVAVPEIRKPTPVQKIQKIIAAGLICIFYPCCVRVV